MYRFVFGGTQSGKSHRVFSDCIDASLRDEAGRFIVIVPEQATTATEKELIRLHPYHAMSNIEVLSFNRLAYRVFEELGIRNPEVLDDISKSMILRRLAANLSGGLTVWKNSFDKPGFVDNLKSMISELYQYGVGPDELEHTSDEDMNIRLKSKLHDLKLIYREFNSYIKDKYITPEEIPDILAREIYRSELIKDATIVLDGFTGFTPIQYRIIESFMMYAKELIITVNIPEDENPYAQPKSDELFYMSRRIVADITDIASRTGTSHGEDIKTDRRPKLDFLERHLLRYDGAVSDNENINIVRALNKNEEVSYITCDIQKKVKLDGYRYRDIAVVGADIDSYAEILKHELELSDIPYYMDENINLNSNVLPAFIQAASEVISSDYSYESIMKYLHTGLVTDDEDMINTLDIYMYECGRRGYSRMMEVWDYVPKSLGKTDMKALNSFKNEVLNPLEPLRNFKGSWEEYAAVIKSLLTGLNVEEKLQHISENFSECDKNLSECSRDLSESNENSSVCGDSTSVDRRRAREYELAYETVIKLLDRIADLAGDEECKPEVFIETFMAGVAQIKLGMLPPGADRVIIGDLTRTRLEHVKHLYVIGTNEGNIPKLLNRGSVISDTEKLILENAGLKLAPTAREDLFMQRYYLYRVLTKPEESLTLSFFTMGEDGSSAEPSYIIAHIKKLYPKLKEINAAAQTDILDVKSAVRLIASKLRDIRKDGVSEDVKEDKRLGDIIATLLADSDYVTAVQKLISAAFFRYTDDRISVEAAEKIYGEKIHSSITRLESFSDCPYRHFARYGLGLYEIKKFTMEAVDIGNIVHATMEKIYSAAERQRVDLFGLDDSGRSELVRDCVQEAVLDDPSAKYNDTSRNKYIISRIERIADRTLWAQLQEFAVSGFRPYLWEQPFNYNGISGRIDRIDIAMPAFSSSPEAVLSQTRAPARIVCESTLPISELTADTDYDSTTDTTADSVKKNEPLLVSGSVNGNVLSQTIRSGERVCESTIPGANPETDKTVSPCTESGTTAPRIRVVDLKTGSKTFSISDIAQGYDLQLGIYMSAAEDLVGQHFRETGVIPSGMYYSSIKDPIINLDDKPDKNTVEDEILKELKLKGIGTGEGDELRIRKVMNHTDRMADELRADIHAGDIAITPTDKGNDINSCTYCPYKAVCGFDKKLPGFTMPKRKNLKQDDAWEIIAGGQLNS